jgi:outer membrane lipoprotein-sorting protein
MKRVAILSVLAALMLSGAFAAQPAPPANNLESVLDRMDQTATTFKTAEAEFVWDQYQKVVDETDTQSGTIYFRRGSKELEMAANIVKPDQKYVLFSGGKVSVFQPKIDQVTQYSAGRNKADFESFLVLGFGGRGHDLPKTFDVTYAGEETVQGVTTSKLVLVPKTQRGRNIFARIILWIDARGVSVQQQFFEPSGDYRLAKYSNIRLNQKISDDVFKLKTTPNTKFVNPQSGF